MGMVGRKFVVFPAQQDQVEALVPLLDSPGQQAARFVRAVSNDMGIYGKAARDRT